jgi:hypothetical protein
VARWAGEGRYGNTARWGNDWRHIGEGGGLIGGQFQLAGDVVGAGARRDAEVHWGGVKLEEVTVGQSGCWRRLVLGGGSSRPRKAAGASSNGLRGGPVA